MRRSVVLITVSQIYYNRRAPRTNLEILGVYIMIYDVSGSIIIFTM